MTTKRCSIDGCTRDHDARGYCKQHYRIAAKKGDIQPKTKYTFEEQLNKHTERREGSDCLYWTGARSVQRNGSRTYGQVYVAGKQIYAHRWIWEHHNGPIPDGLLVLHTCHQGLEGCVEITHLKLGTHKDNAQDAIDRGTFHYGTKNLKHQPDSYPSYDKGQGRGGVGNDRNTHYPSEKQPAVTRRG